MFRNFVFSLLILISSSILTSAQGAHDGHAQAAQPTPSQSLPKCHAIRFSFWGFHHTSCLEDSGKVRRGLHERGIVDQIQNAPITDIGMFSNCCNGVNQGECRVTRVDMKDKKVLVDDQWVPITPRTKIVEVEGLEDDEEAVVCAARSYVGFGYSLPAAYCIGIRSGS